MEIDEETIFKPELSMSNYPNPFKLKTTIDFNLSKPGMVNLSIYNIKGELIKTLINNQTQQGGYYEMIWDGKDNCNHVVASGVYLYQLTAGNRKTSIKKMLLIK